MYPLAQREYPNRAFDPTLNREVAIKVLRDELASDPKFLADFLQEARSAAAISHPHIVHINYVGDDGGRYYIVMELLKGKTLGVDATTLEANAALRSIVRRDSNESYNAFLTTLAQESGIQTPTREDLARIDRKRKKKGSNADWYNPNDPDANKLLIRARQLVESGKQFADPVTKYENLRSELDALSAHVRTEERIYHERAVAETRREIEDQRSKRLREIEMNRARQVEVLMQEALQHRKDGELDAAVNVLKQIVVIDPKHSPARWLLTG